MDVLQPGTDQKTRICPDGYSLKSQFSVYSDTVRVREDRSTNTPSLQTSCLPAEFSAENQAAIHTTITRNIAVTLGLFVIIRKRIFYQRQCCTSPSSVSIFSRHYGVHTLCASRLSDSVFVRRCFILNQEDKAGKNTTLSVWPVKVRFAV